MSLREILKSLLETVDPEADSRIEKLITSQPKRGTRTPLGIKKKEPLKLEYVGGGHFRVAGTPKGVRAGTFHGMEAIEAVLKSIL